jgi:hypothetical protein
MLFAVWISIINSIARDGGKNHALSSTVTSRSNILTSRVLCSHISSKKILISLFQIIIKHFREKKLWCGAFGSWRQAVLQVPTPSA